MGRTGKGMRAQLTSPCGPNTEAMAVTSVSGQSGSACEGPYRPATGYGLSSCAGYL